MLSSTYGDASLCERTGRDWFLSFKSDYFYVEYRHGGGKKKIFKNSVLVTLLASRVKRKNNLK